MDERLTEEQVSDAFHSYLKSGLSQTKVEGLLDTDLLSSAEADLMITGPALCLYFAALRSTTSPPSVPLPRTPASSNDPVDLSLENCPSPFIPFMSVWARNVPVIQDLSPDQQHDLARIICGLQPIFTTSTPSSESPSSANALSKRIAAEFRALAIEISQRRTFQDRYAADLQAVIDEGSGRMSGRRRVLASFKPPPTYDEASLPSSSRSHTPEPVKPWGTTSPKGSPSTPSSRPPSMMSSPTHGTVHLPPRDRLVPPLVPPKSIRSRSPRNVSPPSASPGSAQGDQRTFAIDAPPIQLIRETLYASLADVLASHPYLCQLLKRDPPRAYFASVALAILDVSLSHTEYRVRVRADAGEDAEEDADVVVHGVLSTPLTLAACPAPLQPFMRELGAIGAAARAAQEEDTVLALMVLERDPDATLPVPRMERVRRMLERGITAEYDDGQEGDKDVHGDGGSRLKKHGRGNANATAVPSPTSAGDGRGRTSRRYSAEEDARRHGRGTRGSNDDGRGRRSVEGRALVLVNRINALSLGMSKLRAFSERQSEIFKILVASVS